MTLREAIDAKREPGECVVVPFYAIRRGEQVVVTAVLKRTAIFQDHRSNERHLDLHETFEVGDLEWRDCSHLNGALASSARGRRASRLFTRRRSGP